MRDRGNGLAQSQPASDATGQDKQGCQAALVIGLIVLFVIALKSCDTKPTATIDVEQPFGAAALGNQIDAVEPPARVEPLAPLQVRHGLRHLGLVIAAEGLPGAMIYSQSCYDGVSQGFSWAALDRCGGFDLQAVRLAEQSLETDLPSELAYFEPETAAARYLALAVKAGESAESADLRLEALQKQIASARLPAATASNSDSGESDSDEGDGSDPSAVSQPPDPGEEAVDQDWIDRMTGNLTD